ncbi:MAG: hypothetical protein IID54_05265 [Proteobacteria bacterium]|nr:hypothetical protein [Pseudomonadota bacterium]
MSRYRNNERRPELRRPYYSKPLCYLGVALALFAFGFPVTPVQADGELRVLAFGDSLTAGYGLTKSEGFPAKLEQSLRAHGIDAKVTNAGVSGDTTAGGRARLNPQRLIGHGIPA